MKACDSKEVKETIRAIEKRFAGSPYLIRCESLPEDLKEMIEKVFIAGVIFGEGIEPGT